MKRYINRRSLALVGVLLASQLLSACVIVPQPYYRHRMGVVEPGYNGAPQGEYRDRRNWDRR
jgi:hypothetical protein